MPLSSPLQRLLFAGLLGLLTALRPAVALSRGLTTLSPQSRSLRGKRLRGRRRIAVGDELTSRGDVARATSYLMTRAGAAATVTAVAEPSAVVEPAAAAAPRPPSVAAQWHLERRRAILAKHPEVSSDTLACAGACQT